MYPPTDVPTHHHHNKLKLLGEFVPINVDDKHIELVDKNSNLIQTQVGEEGQEIIYYVPVKAWKQLLPD